MAKRKFKCACGTTESRTGKDAEKILYKKAIKKPSKRGRK